MTLEEVLALPIHPAAEAFEMLPSDELDELAEDIKENGLQYPIIIKPLVLNGDDEPRTYLIDGRNRREACRRAGVMPKVQELNGADPEAFVVSSNVKRRHLTLGQRAMGVAIVYPKAPLGRGSIDEGKKVALKANFSQRSLERARTLLADFPLLVAQVKSGSLDLTDAYDRAVAEKKKEETEEARFAKIQDKAPDLAKLIVEKKIGISAAEQEVIDRAEQAFNQRRSLFQNYAEAIDAIAYFARVPVGDFLSAANEYPKEFASYRRGGGDDEPAVIEYSEVIRHAAASMAKLLESKNREGSK